MPGNAPALERGIHLFRLMEDGRGWSLEELTGRSGLPKPSVLRMAETLARMGLIERDRETKRFRAMLRLAPMETSDQSFRKRLQELLLGLSQLSGQTAEWYVPRPEGLTLAEHQLPPKGVVLVRARIGFVRSWKGEIDAVNLVGRAFSPTPVRACADAWRYAEDGATVSLSQEQLQQCVADVRRQQLAVDEEYNSNGIRRMAAPVMAAGELRGVLAVAIAFYPGERKEQARRVQALQTAAQALSD